MPSARAQIPSFRGVRHLHSVRHSRESGNPGGRAVSDPSAENVQRLPFTQNASRGQKPSCKPYASSAPPGSPLSRGRRVLHSCAQELPFAFIVSVRVRCHARASSSPEAPEGVPGTSIRAPGLRRACRGAGDGSCTPADCDRDRRSARHPTPGGSARAGPERCTGE